MSSSGSAASSASVDRRDRTGSVDEHQRRDARRGRARRPAPGPPRPARRRGVASSALTAAIRSAGVGFDAIGAKCLAIRACKVLRRYVRGHHSANRSRGVRCDSRTRSRSSPAAAAGMGRVAAQLFAARGRAGRRRRVQRGGRQRDRRPRPRPRAARPPSSAPTSRRRPTRRRWSTTRSRPTAGSTASTTTPAIMPEADHSVIDTDVDDLGRGHGGQRARRLPRLQVRHPGDDRRRAAARSSTSRASSRSSAAASRRTPTPPRRARSCR